MSIWVLTFISMNITEVTTSLLKNCLRSQRGLEVPSLMGVVNSKETQRDNAPQHLSVSQGGCEVGEDSSFLKVLGCSGG